MEVKRGIRTKAGRPFRLFAGIGGQGMLLLALLAAALSGCSAADSSGGSEAAKSSAADVRTDALAQSGAAAASNAAAPAEGKSAAPAADGKQSASPPADSFNGSVPAAAGDAYGAVDRKIIYKASLTMQVEKYAEAQTQIESAVRQAGGYVLQFTENETSYEKRGSFVIKVPASGFGSLLNQLESIHPTTQKNMEGQDVSEEYVDLTARLKAKQVVEERLISFMEKAAKTDELLAFSNELGKTQEEIERIKGRMRYLEQNVAYSTIELRLTQKLGSAAVIQAQDQGPLMQRVSAALNGSTAALALFFQWVVVVLAAILPVALVLAVIAVPFWLIRKARRKKLHEIRRKLSDSDDALAPLPPADEGSAEAEK